eukprot:TRINITY_DN653_c0_g1_i1.p1 TRINITY_DN653_c0_g1~~TRINITY_DN653_c0_g1_i1.p1  ORF type:complete len:270 (+),score=72.05 TRINITY_DN653_c0_g1_i1:215-1024(+)
MSFFRRVYGLFQAYRQFGNKYKVAALKKARETVKETEQMANLGSVVTKTFEPALREAIAMQHAAIEKNNIIRQQHLMFLNQLKEQKMKEQGLQGLRTPEMREKMLNMLHHNGLDVERTVEDLLSKHEVADPSSFNSKSLTPEMKTYLAQAKEAKSKQVQIPLEQAEEAANAMLKRLKESPDVTPEEIQHFEQCVTEVQEEQRDANAIRKRMSEGQKVEDDEIQKFVKRMNERQSKQMNDFQKLRDWKMEITKKKEKEARGAGTNATKAA